MAHDPHDEPTGLAPPASSETTARSQTLSLGSLPSVCLLLLSSTRLALLVYSRTQPGCRRCLPVATSNVFSSLHAKPVFRTPAGIDAFGTASYPVYAILLDHTILLIFMVPYDYKPWTCCLVKVPTTSDTTQLDPSPCSSPPPSMSTETPVRRQTPSPGSACILLLVTRHFPLPTPTTRTFFIWHYLRLQLRPTAPPELQ